MNVNRGLVFWGVALITAGAVALGVQSGAIAGDAMRELWRFWPVVLIAIGVAVIAARTPFALIATILAALVAGGMAGTLVGGFPEGFGVDCGGETDRATREAGTFDGAATVEIELNCGALAISTGRGADWSVDARYAGASEPSVDSTPTSLRVSADGDGPFGFGQGRQEWDVTIPTDRELDLAIEANASESTIDLGAATVGDLDLDANAGDLGLRLHGATIRGLDLDANAGSITIDTDDATRLDGSVSTNAGSIRLCVPDGTGVEITIADENVAFSHNLRERGLDRRGDTWSVGDEPTIMLEVDGNAASLTLNPEDGCS